MTKNGLTIDGQNGVKTIATAQGIAGIEDDRPFAEIRRNMQDVMRMLSQHRWAFFVPMCIVTSAAFILSLYYPRTYTASTTFERRNDPIMVNLPNSAGAASSDYFRSTTTRDIKSVVNMAQVVEALGLTEALARNEDGTLTSQGKRRRDSLAASLAAHIDVSTVSPNEDIDVIRLSYTGSDPTIGAKLLDEVKRTYILHTKAWMKDFLHSQRDYYVSELAQADKRLKAAKRADTQLRLELPYTDPRDPSAIATRLSQLELERHELLLRRRESDEEMSAFQQIMADLEVRLQGGDATDETPVPLRLLSAEARQLAGEIRRIDTKIEELRQTRGMTDEHPQIRALVGRRDWIATALSDQKQRDIEDSLAGIGEAGGAVLASGQPLSAEHARLLVQIDKQKSRMASLEIDLTVNGEAATRLHKVKSNVYVNQEAMADVAAAVGRAEREYARLSETVSEIEPAIKASEQDRLLHFPASKPALGSSIPLNPKASTIILLAVLAGVAVGVVFVILAEILDRVFRSSTQVARTLGLPILDVIDEIVTSADRRRNLIRRTVLAPLAMVCCLGVTVVTGSLAFLSIQYPWTYQRIQGLPDRAMEYIADVDDHAAGDETARES